MITFYSFSTSIVKSEGLRLFPHDLHLLSCVRKMSRTGLKLITFERIVPHLPQITSVDGYDITLSPSKRSSKTILSKSIDQ
jgi:hypothetical protein